MAGVQDDSSLWKGTSLDPGMSTSSGSSRGPGAEVGAGTGRFGGCGPELVLELVLVLTLAPDVALPLEVPTAPVVLPELTGEQSLGPHSPSRAGAGAGAGVALAPRLALHPGLCQERL